MKATYADSPWALLLNHNGCHRNSHQTLAPCPCVWKRPRHAAAQSDDELREHRWDWRDCMSERDIRLGQQHRELTPVQR